MNESSEREERLFAMALEITDPDKRAEFLSVACGDDTELRQRLEHLLSLHPGADAAFPTEPDELTEIVAVSEGPGDTIGKYKLLEQIGEGGMGVVYMAEQSVPFHKRVALKIIKLGMDTKAVVARFNAEYQALALMNHPSIAKVLDAGATDTGRPFFVMEYVRGIPITEYCDQHKLSTRQRLELFIPVCQAVQHAHQKGIIHRDIKPSNVLVANFDGRPAPMVIDFGIAKAVNQRLSQETFFTRHGQFIGTLEYIAPEQAEGSQIDIDTRADIYSLGVLLYQLLTGTTPFPGKRLRESAWRETMRIIQEEEPQKPSDRMSTLTAEQGTTIAKTHGGEAARKISLVLRQELDLVVLKCLEKDRTRRYETANGLALELERYLKGEPVGVVPPTIRYQLVKFARKHKKTVAMAAGIAVILAVATVFSTWQMFRAEQAEELATKRADKLAASNGFWVDLVGQGNAYGTMLAGVRSGQEQKANLKLVDAILQVSESLHERFESQPEIEGELRLTIGKALNSLGYNEEALENLQAAEELFESSLGSSSTNTISARFWKGWSMYQRALGTSKEADTYLEVIRQACTEARDFHGEKSPFAIELGAYLGLQLTREGEIDEADKIFRETLALVGSVASPNPNFSDPFRRFVVGCVANLRREQGRDGRAKIFL